MSTTTVAEKPATPTRARPTKAEAKQRAVVAAAILMKQASDPTRIQVLLTLLDGEKNVSQMSEQFNLSQPALSHHLALLRHGSLVAPRRAGKNNFYGLTDKGRALAETARALIEG